MEFQVQITGLDTLVAKLKEAPSNAAPILQRAIDASHAILASHTSKATVPWKTGFLAQQWGWDSLPLGGRWFPRASYASFVEFGTAPHVIEAKNKKALHWGGDGGPFAKRVNHPGTKPNDFIGRIIDASKEEINTQFGKALEQIVAQIAA